MTPRLPRIDAHQHFWKVSRGDYGWLTPELGVLYRDFLPEDFVDLAEKHDVVGTVLVQAAPTIDETHYMLSLAVAHPFIRGVVGWVDFEAAEAAGQIEALAAHPKLVGLRPMIQDIPQDDWMLKETHAPAFEALIQQSLVFDALTLPRHLPHLFDLLKRYPAMKSIIDHGSKPEIRESGFQKWAKDIQIIAEETNTYCKISGLVTEAAEAWSVEDLKPYVDHLLENFGPDRLVWGSDWPVCLLAANYADWVAATEQLLSQLEEVQKRRIYFENAIELYGLDVSLA